jgi:hypothetical protein
LNITAATDSFKGKFTNSILLIFIGVRSSWRHILAQLAMLLNMWDQDEPRFGRGVSIDDVQIFGDK